MIHLGSRPFWKPIWSSELSERSEESHAPRDKRPCLTTQAWDDSLSSLSSQLQMASESHAAANALQLHAGGRLP
jgi:hypothetical protein